MREHRNEWVLPIAGRVVFRLCVDRDLDYALAGAGGDATIRISAEFQIQDGSGSQWSLRPGSDASALAPALKLVGLTVDSAAARKDGTLDVTFQGGTRLRVPPDPDYEAWEFIGERGLKIVSLPGGELAVWKEAA